MKDHACLRLSIAAFCYKIDNGKTFVNMNYAGGVGAAALGATAFILTSSDNGGGPKTESLPPFQWPPAGK